MEALIIPVSGSVQSLLKITVNGVSCRITAMPHETNRCFAVITGLRICGNDLHHGPVIIFIAKQRCTEYQLIKLRTPLRQRLPMLFQNGRFEELLQAE